jgi:hypothetical protein
MHHVCFWHKSEDVVIALIAGGLFVRQREAQLTIEGERAIPGSLELR